MRLKLSFLAVAFVCLLFSVTMAHAQMTSQHYAITSSVLSGGGIPMSSSSFRTEGTLGQPSPLMHLDGSPASTNYLLFPGFWYTLDAIASCIWDLEPEPPDGDVDGADLSEFADRYGIGGYGTDDLADFVWEFGRSNCSN